MAGENQNQKKAQEDLNHVLQARRDKLAELQEIIHTGKGKTTSDEEGFYQMLQDAAAKLTDMI